MAGKHEPGAAIQRTSAYENNGLASISLLLLNQSANKTPQISFLRAQVALFYDYYDLGGSPTLPPSLPPSFTHSLTHSSVQHAAAFGDCGPSSPPCNQVGLFESSAAGALAPGRTVTHNWHPAVTVPPPRRPRPAPRRYGIIRSFIIR
eukprot:765854-Hanusia_phi.AAC.2